MNTNAWNVATFQRYFFAALIAEVLSAQFAAVGIWRDFCPLLTV